MCVSRAQLVEHRTGIAEVTGSNPVEALIFVRLLLSICLNSKIYCEDHSSLCFVLPGTCQHCVEKICNASQTAYADQLQNNPFTLSSSVL